MTTKIRTLANLDPDLHARLVNESRRTGAPLTEIIRRALSAYLEGKQ